MAKGNHVFNNFSGVVEEAYRMILREFFVRPGDPSSLTYDKHLNALENKEGRAGDIPLAELELKNGKLSESYAKYREITNHKTMDRIHQIQDDAPVPPNDPNSQSFGEAATQFKLAAVGWAIGQVGADPSVAWRQMVNSGFDPMAHTNYVSAASTPKAKDERQSECIEIRKFISGELSKMVFNWLLMLRKDLKTAKLATYDEKSKTWQSMLTLPPAFMPPASGSRSG